MTTTGAPEITTDCPSWCDLKPGHEPDSEWPDGRLTRGHGGPNFGPFVSLSAYEFVDEPGRLILDIHVSDDVQDRVTKPENAVDLARNLLTAAQWFEAPMTAVHDWILANALASSPEPNLITVAEVARLLRARQP